jgi:hypothetical protein
MRSVRVAHDTPQATEMCATLPFTGLPPGGTIPNTICSSTPFEFLKLFSAYVPYFEKIE